MFLKPIKPSKRIEKEVANKIVVWIWQNLFQEIFYILKPSTVENGIEKLAEAILSGRIWYENGAFYSNRSRFSNELAYELEQLGAKYSSHKNAYLLTQNKLPTSVLGAIQTAQAKLAFKLTAIDAFLLNQLGNLDKLISKLTFDTIAETMFQNLQDRVYKNAREQKIELITPKFDDFTANEFAQRYTNNLDFWIKNWTPQQITKMREVVGQMALDGKSYNSIIKYFEKEFNVSQNKAKFLARNETAIATASYVNAKYQAEGFTHFRWHHTDISKEPRTYHKKDFKEGGLNNGIFRYDDPPIIEELATKEGREQGLPKPNGKKGLPGQTYNCSCVAQPYANKEFWDNRRRMFKANNSIFKKIKDFFKC